MAVFSEFSKGDLLFRQGDPSDRVLWICRGEIDVLREAGETMIVLGHVQTGEWLGEMGVIERRCRSATARASADGMAEVLTAQQFLERVSRDPMLAFDLLQRLCVRLRTMGDKVSGDLTGDPSPGAREVVSLASPAEEMNVSLTAGSDELRAFIGAAPMQITGLPYVVGRVAAEGEDEPARRPDLLIEDDKPFRLSREHFMITCDQGQLVVSDLGSTLGTIVNGQALGHHFMRDRALLKPGQNRIVAGGWGSPYDFTVTVAREV